MINTYSPQDTSLQEKFFSLKRVISEQKEKSLKKRLNENITLTDMEYITGAFMEMYEPYLVDIVCKLFEKGYIVETSSGFNSPSPQYQSLVGNFTLDYITRNKLEKEGIKVRDFDGSKSLVFWAEKPDIEFIRQKWLKIIGFLPDKGKMDKPSERATAKLFRRKYNSKNPKFQKLSLFENLKHKIQQSLEKEVSKRKKTNPHPSEIEYKLGVFIEELEPQVRQAVIDLHNKGYSTDLSGFLKHSCDQIIEGDFQLPEDIVLKINKLGINVELNPSGYTRLQFTPEDAEIGKIKEKWAEVVSVFPSKNSKAEVSMTKSAREFRMKYA